MSNSKLVHLWGVKGLNGISPTSISATRMEAECFKNSWVASAPTSEEGLRRAQELSVVPVVVIEQAAYQLDTENDTSDDTSKTLGAHGTG
jgi:hypothetical protein